MFLLLGMVSGSKIFQLFFEILASKIFCGVTTYRCFYLLWYDWYERYGTGTRLQTDRQLGGSFEHRNTFCNTCPSCRGGDGTNSKKRLKGIMDWQTGKDKDAMNVTFVYYVPSPHMICINPYIFRYISIRTIHELKAVVLLFFSIWPSPSLFLYLNRYMSPL